MPCTHVERFNALCMGELYGAKWFARNTACILLKVGCPEKCVTTDTPIYIPKVRNGQAAAAHSYFLTVFSWYPAAIDYPKADLGVSYTNLNLYLFNQVRRIILRAVDLAANRVGFH